MPALSYGESGMIENGKRPDLKLEYDAKESINI